MGRNIALVLSSGGARGFAHVGVINMLLAEGFQISSVAGTSMGALVGGMFATGRLEEFEKWSRSLDKMEVLKLTDFSISTKGLVKGNKVIKRLKEIVPSRKIEDLGIPFCAVATDIVQGTEVVFRDGDLYEAIRASISIPTVFQPLKKGKKLMVDGGLLNPIPIEHVQRSGHDLLVVVDVNAPVQAPTRPEEVEKHTDHQLLELMDRIKEKLSEIIPVHKREDLGIFNLSNKSIQTMMRRISELTLEKYKPDFVIQVSREAFGAFEFYKAEEIIQEGERAAIEALKNWNVR